MDADKLVAVYVKIRDAKAAKTKEMEDAIKALDDQLDVIEQELLTICKTTGQDGGKTSAGSFTRSVKTRYWTSDWDSMYKFILESKGCLNFWNVVLPKAISKTSSRTTQTTCLRVLMLSPSTQSPFVVPLINL